MDLRTHKLTPEEWEEFKNRVHEAVTEIQAEIADPNHPREAKPVPRGIPLSEDELSLYQHGAAVAANKRLKELEQEVARLTQMVEASRQTPPPKGKPAGGVVPPATGLESVPGGD